LYGEPSAPCGWGFKGHRRAYHVHLVWQKPSTSLAFAYSSASLLPSYYNYSAKESVILGIPQVNLRSRAISQRPPSLFLKKGMRIMPATNPPICPHHATPSPVIGSTRVKVPENNWSKNHHPKKMNAGSSMKKGIIKMGMNVRILAFGNIT